MRAAIAQRLAILLPAILTTMGGAAAQQVEIGTRSEAGSTVKVQTGPNGAAITSESKASVETKVRVQMPAAPSVQHPSDQRGGGSAAAGRQPKPYSGQAGLGPGSSYPPGSGYPSAMPLHGASTPQGLALPGSGAAHPGNPNGQGLSNLGTAAGQNDPNLVQPAGAPPKAATHRQVPCETIVEFRQNGLDIRVVNKTCRGSVVGLRAWREDGKTRVQFSVDNKAGATAPMRLAEAWSDARGRVIPALLDEQSIVIEARRSKTILLSGPVPNATVAVLSLIK